MVISVSDKEPQLKSDTSASESAKLTVTGLDEKGQMFREISPIIGMDGRNCSFRSKYRLELGSWVLIEIDLSKMGSKKSALQGQVKSVQADDVATNLFQVQVELETAQELKVASSPQPPTASPQASQLAPASPSKVAPAIAPKAVLPAAWSKPEGIVQAGVPAENKPAKISAPASRDLAAPAPAASSEIQRESAKSAIVSEVKEQLAALKVSFSRELEQIAERTVSSTMDQVIRQAIEKQIAVSYQAAIQTLNSDVAYQVVGRVASSEELRASIEKLATKALDNQIESSRNSAIEAQQNLNSRIAEITHSVETSLADTEAKVKVASDIVTAAEDRAQVLEKEVADATVRLQKAGDQLNQSARSTIEKFDGHVTTQLNSWSVQFKNHLDSACREKAAQFAAELQQQAASSNQQVNEIAEKLTAGMQLVRGMVRMQEEQLNEVLEKLTAGMQLAQDTIRTQEERGNGVLEKLSAAVQLAQGTIRMQEEQGNEVLEKLTASMQLAQGMTRMQEERLAELSRASVTNFEKDIKDALLRLASFA